MAAASINLEPICLFCQPGGNKHGFRKSLLLESLPTAALKPSVQRSVLSGETESQEKF